MSKLDVHHGSELVGTLAMVRGGIFFEYAASFIAVGRELSPLALPLGPGIRSRDATPSMRLPGLFEDSLPDAWGARVMDDWFRQQGTPYASIDPLMRLSFIGSRGLGALTYAPALDIHASRGTLDSVYTAAAQLAAGAPTDLVLLAAVGSSPGGARPKAALWFDEPMERIAHQYAEACPDAWLVKFDTGAGRGQARMEYAYSLMARAAGIEFPETRILTTPHAEGPREHFAVRRFDRVGASRIHYHSLAGLCQILGSDLDYQTLLRVTRRVTQDYLEVLKAYRRAVFNVLASNRDDHGKNHGFLYEGKQWRLSPAFDVTFSGPGQLRDRGLAVLGERINAGRKQLEELAHSEGLARRDVQQIFAEVRGALDRWPEFSAAAGLPPRELSLIHI